MFKKILVPALVLAAASAALPAAAQSYSAQSHGAQSYGAQSHGAPRHGPAQHGPAHNANYGGWQAINQRQANLDRRIDVGLRNGAISRREATRLRNEFNQIARLEQQYRRNGLSQWERTDLDRRFDRLSAQIRNERWDNNNRHGRGRG